MNGGSEAQAQPAASPGALRSFLAGNPWPALLLTAVVSAAAAVAVAVAVIPGSSSRAPASTAATRRVDLGQIWGAAYRGRASSYESLSRAETQANQVPAGATVDPATNTVRLAGTHPQITIVANPPNARNMAFRAAGLENPTIQVRSGANVTVRFVNGDSDSAHGWLLLDPIVQVGGTFHGPRAFAGSYAPILGDPTSGGQPAETIHFQASASGTYRYECPVPGHAAMGMQGKLVVTA